MKTNFVPRIPGAKNIFIYFERKEDGNDRICSIA